MAEGEPGVGHSGAATHHRQRIGHGGTETHPAAGIADIEGERIDVVSQGEYIEAGAPIVVIRVDGNRIVVRRARGEPAKE